MIAFFSFFISSRCCYYFFSSYIKRATVCNGYCVNCSYTCELSDMVKVPSVKNMGNNVGLYVPRYGC